MKNYQLKFDFGEGEDCHKAYELWLEHHGYLDTNPRWVHFQEVWKGLEAFKKDQDDTRSKA